MKKILLTILLLQSIAQAQQTTNNATNYGTNVTQNSAGTNGAYVRFSPLSYNPFDGGTCMDIFGNEVQQPLGTNGAKSFGPNDLLLWNSLSPEMPANGVGCPATTLSGNINSSVTAIPVTSGANIQNNNVIQIDNEQMLVTAGGGTTSLTVTRNYSVNGIPTGAVSHTSGTVVGNTLPINLIYGLNTNPLLFYLINSN